MFSSIVWNTHWPQAEELTQGTGKRSLYHLLDPPYTSSQFACMVSSFRRGLDREKQKRKTAEGRQTKTKTPLTLDTEAGKCSPLCHSHALSHISLHTVLAWDMDLPATAPGSWLDNYVRMNILCHRAASFSTVPLVFLAWFPVSGSHRLLPSLHDDIHLDHKILTNNWKLLHSQKMLRRPLHWHAPASEQNSSLPHKFNTVSNFVGRK